MITLEDAYNLYSKQLFTYCYYVTGDKDLSKDIVHEVFVKLASQNRQNIKSIRDWLFICTRNLTYNSLRKLKRQRIEPVKTPSSLTIEQKIFINQILHKLDIEERELILMKEKYGYTIKELSDMLSISEENVRIKLFRIRKKMQRFAKE